MTAPPATVFNLGQPQPGASNDDVFFRVQATCRMMKYRRQGEA